MKAYLSASVVYQIGTDKSTKNVENRKVDINVVLIKLPELYLFVLDKYSAACNEKAIFYFKFNSPLLLSKKRCVYSYKKIKIFIKLAITLKHCCQVWYWQQCR